MGLALFLLRQSRAPYPLVSLPLARARTFWVAFLAATTLIFGAAYTLWMYKRVIFGDVANAEVGALQDINAREFAILGLLAVMVLWMGLHPAQLTDVMHVSVGDLLKHVGQSKL